LQSAWSRLRRGGYGREPAVAHDVDFDRALVVATFVQLPMGSVQVGEIGFCAWMYIGFGLATLAAAREQARALRTGLGRAVAIAPRSAA